MRAQDSYSRALPASDASQPQPRWLQMLMLIVLLSSGWAGCRCRPTSSAKEQASEPSVRLVLLSTVAGALEPCGCVKDMLGGVDHAAAFLRGQQSTPTLALAAGPLLFLDPELNPERRDQDVWKAEALYRSLAEMKVRAWAPGFNDFAAGNGELARFSSLAAQGPAPLAANLHAAGVQLGASAIYSVGGIKVGVVGLSVPQRLGQAPKDVSSDELAPVLQREATNVTQQGAQIKVLLLALPRGQALRLIESVPGFQVALLGKPIDQGETNDPIPPPSSLGDTLVIEGPNHLQAFYVVDLFVKNGQYKFENANQSSEELNELDARIADLTARLDQAEHQNNVRPDDLAARRNDLKALRERRRALATPSVAPSNSYYVARAVEIRESLGKDPGVSGLLGDYYRRVNEHNREIFADRVAPPVNEGESAYVGVGQCGTCHYSQEKFWRTTQHFGAYETLSKASKEFNLDCVSCHVTGYGERGGSTVTHVENLKSVQCEVCHGPGSRHVQNPTDHSLIVGKPDHALCASKCHHPPHVKADWSAEVALTKIIGPGHGAPP